MLFGGPSEERIILNESSVWSGSRQDADRTNAAKALPEIRRLLQLRRALPVEFEEPVLAARHRFSRSGLFLTLINP